MRFFFIFSVLICSSSWATCLRNPGEDYATQYDIDPQEILYSFDVPLGKKGSELLLLAGKSSCGARSCEYAGYVKDKKGCFYRVIAFTGSFQAGTKQSNGLKSLVVHLPMEDGARLSCEWVYRPIARVMTQVPSSCQKNKVN
jgi:hypothetical protein